MPSNRVFLSCSRPGCGLSALQRYAVTPTSTSSSVRPVVTVPVSVTPPLPTSPSAAAATTLTVSTTAATAAPGEPSDGPVTDQVQVVLPVFCRYNCRAPRLVMPGPCAACRCTSGLGGTASGCSPVTGRSSTNDCHCHRPFHRRCRRRQVGRHVCVGRPPRHHLCSLRAVQRRDRGAAAVGCFDRRHPTV